MLLQVALSKATIHDVPIAEAKRAWMAHRVAEGWLSYQNLLTPPDANAKFAKSKDAVVYGLSLAPFNLSGHNVCPFSTPECRRGCVSFAGNGRYDVVSRARAGRTRFLREDPSAFLAILRNETERLQLRFPDLAVRLNTFSDIAWERVHPEVFIPGVRYFDYTKDWSRSSSKAYHLTFSASEKTTDEQILKRTSAGENVAVVFDTARSKPLPETWLGVTVIDGDKSDVRFNDPKGVIVGLRAKGRMRKGNWGMVRSTTVC